VPKVGDQEDSSSSRPDPQSAPGTSKDQSLQGRIDQVKDLEKAQQNQNKTKKPIDSTTKSKQNLDNALKKIKSLDDAEHEDH
jgi:hypothetical protein